MASHLLPCQQGVLGSCQCQAAAAALYLLRRHGMLSDMDGPSM